MKLVADFVSLDLSHMDGGKEEGTFMRYAMTAAFTALLALCSAAPTQAADEPTLDEFVNYCSTREAECIALLGRDFTAMQESMCMPDNYPAGKAAGQVLADLRSIAAAQPGRLSTGYDIVEMEIFKKYWACH